MKPEEILVDTFNRFTINGYPEEHRVAVIYDPRVEGGRAAIFLGDDRVERAGAEAQRMRDALPQPRFEIRDAAHGHQVWDRKENLWVTEPRQAHQREFPALVQHICAWLNEQAN